MTIYAIYARYSSSKQQETSIEDQVRRCREYIERSGEDASAARVFSDSAISGASLDRPDFESMMREVDSGRIQAIVTEDMSRISRDFADSATIFKKLQYARVPLIGVADGINTGEKNSKISFTIKSLLSDVYLDELRDKTLRGLRGKALADKATGPVPYGYTTFPASDGNGSDILIHPEFTAIVQRIFQLFHDGYTYSRIAKLLNQEGVPSPRAKTNHASRGWPDTTIRSMLRNRKYVGYWPYDEYEWIKRPGTNKRVRRKKDPSETIMRERPDLRIIDERTWSAVQARLEKTRRRYTGENDDGRKTVSLAARAVYPLSGLLRCPCGVPLTIYGGTRSSKRYRCPDNFKRGTCANALGLREDLARRVILDGVRSRLMRPKAVEFIRSELARLLGAANREVDTELTRRRKLLFRTEGKIGGLVEFIATGDKSEYVVATLHDLEALAKTEQAAIRSLERQATKPVALPSLDELVASVLDIEQAFAEDPIVGRHRLHALFVDGRVNLSVDGDTYVAKSALLPLMALKRPETTTGDPVKGRRYIELVAGTRYALCIPRYRYRLRCGSWPSPPSACVERPRVLLSAHRG